METKTRQRARTPTEVGNRVTAILIDPKGGPITHIDVIDEGGSGVFFLDVYREVQPKGKQS